jgi:hypothetical protein
VVFACVKKLKRFSFIFWGGKKSNKSRSRVT